jgi:beta-carotene/zeaxanthin 4-ketolase
MGTIIGLLILLAWTGHLVYCFFVFAPSGLESVWIQAAVHLVLQAYLTTGLFITAHDAMHGSVSRSRAINHALGFIACFLFAGMSYARLRVNHYEHHRAPASEHDPDFYTHSQNFWRWFGSFIWRYKTWSQIAVMAVFYNLFQHLGHVSELKIWLFWMLPSFFGSLQLFYVGTYLPHRLPLTSEMLPHHARSQRKNHLWAMVSC